jgi:CDP-diacylglycerol---glycerol-3-phosphate 3-phosphatidyltransferase
VTRGEPRYSSHKFLTPANGITFLRLASTPVMLALISAHRVAAYTLALWTVLCVTDWLDGQLARRYGVSKSGAFLDPLADKILVLGAMGMLVYRHVFWILPVALIAVREVAMSLYRSVVARRGISIPARKSAKYKTFVQQVCVGFTLLPWVAIHATWVAISLLWLAVALTLATGWQYLRDGRRSVAEPPVPAAVTVGSTSFPV